MSNSVARSTYALVDVRKGTDSQAFYLNTSEMLHTIRAMLIEHNYMKADDFFYREMTPINKRQEALIPLSEILKENAFSISHVAVSVQNATDQYNQLSTASKQALFRMLGLFRGLSFTSPAGFVQNFRDVYFYKDTSLPAANKPQILTELKSSYSFSKVTYELTRFGSHSASVQFSAPFVSAKAEFEHERSQTTSGSLVKEYTIIRYIVRKALLQHDPLQLAPNPEFIQAISEVVKNRKRNIDEYSRLIEVLNQWGYYIPLRYTIGGVIYGSEESEISELSKAESEKMKVGASFEASFKGIGGGAAYSNTTGSSSQNTQSQTNTELMLHMIGGEPGTIKDYPKWAESLSTWTNWAVTEADGFYPTLALLDSVDEGRTPLTNAIKLLSAWRDAQEVQAYQPYLDMPRYCDKVQEIIATRQNESHH